MWHALVLACGLHALVRYVERGTLARRHAPVLYRTLNAALTQLLDEAELEDIDLYFCTSKSICTSKASHEPLLDEAQLEDIDHAVNRGRGSAQANAAASVFVLLYQ